MTKTAKSILRNLSNTVEWCVEPQLLSRATIDRQREQAALDQAIKEIESLIRTEKLKLLAEVRKRVIGEDLPPDVATDSGIGYSRQQFAINMGKAGQRTKLAKLEAEL